MNAMISEETVYAITDGRWSFIVYILQNLMMGCGEDLINHKTETVQMPLNFQCNNEHQSEVVSSLSSFLEVSGKPVQEDFKVVSRQLGKSSKQHPSSCPQGIHQ